MCLPFDTLEPTTAKGRECVQYMQILAGVEIIIGLLKMFVFKDIMGGFYELMSVMILWMAWSQLSYCICLLYIVYICIIGAITYAVNLLTPIQNGIPIFGKTGLEHVVVALSIIFLIFYIVAAYFVFQAYREFKALQYEMNGQAGIFGGGPSGNGGQAVGGAQFQQPQARPANSYGANVNYGGAGGGDTEAYFPQSNRNNANTSNNNIVSSSNLTGNSSGGQFFTGKGVRIG